MFVSISVISFSTDIERLFNSGISIYINNTKFVYSVY